MEQPQKEQERTPEETGNTNTEEILLTRSLSKELGLDKEKGKTE